MEAPALRLYLDLAMGLAELHFLDRSAKGHLEMAHARLKILVSVDAPPIYMDAASV